MKVATKGLFVIAAPLICQIILVAIVSVLLVHMQDQNNQVAKSKDIVAECNNLTLKVAEVARTLFSSNTQGGFFAPPLTQKDVDFIKTSVEALKALLKEEPEQVDNIERLNQFTTHFIKQLVDAKQANTTATSLGLPRIQQDYLELKLFKTGQKLCAALENIVAVETANHPDLSEEQKQSRQLLKIFLAGAVFINALFTFWIAQLNSRTISKPLERMVKNAGSISKREPLEPELQSTDELGDLDRVLHAVNRAIEEALTTERNLINNAADLVCSIDRHGIFKSANPFAQQLLGYTADELLGTSVVSVTLPQDCDRVDRFLTANYADAESRALELRMQRKDKQIIDTSWSAIWSQREENFFCVAHDTTERKHIERLKQDFIAMISHDLRTPLMSVLSSINLIQSGASGAISIDVENDLNNAEQSVEHLIELVNDLLDFEKLEAGRMDFEIVPLKLSSAVFSESARLVQALASERKVTIELPAIDQSAAGDQRKLVQVVVNLLSNALKHSPELSTIRIQTRAIGSFVEVSVHDQGPGVPDEFAEKIFAPFEQIAHRATAALGTGLGLAICKLVVEGHGGKIGVRRSDILEGSAFWFTIPLNSE